LDIEIVDEISEKHEDPSCMNEKVISEISNFLDFKYLIIPILKQKEGLCTIVVLENQLDAFRNSILVKLYDRDRSEFLEEEDSAEHSEKISNIIHCIIQISLGTTSTESYNERLEADTEIIEVDDECEMIPSILQIAESCILHKSQFPDETQEEHKHKIMDRLLAFSELIK